MPSPKDLARRPAPLGNTSPEPTEPSTPRWQFSVEWKTKGSEWQHRHFMDEALATEFYLMCKEARNLRVAKLRKRELIPWTTIVEYRPDDPMVGT